MDFFAVLHAGIALTTLALGVLVFLTNRRRATNVVFLCLALFLVSWLSSLGLAFYFSHFGVAALMVRVSNAIGAFAPFTFNALRLAIVHRARPGRFILRHSWVWLISAAAISALCFTRIFLREVIVSGEGIPEPVYGPGFLLYSAYSLCFFLIVVMRFVGDLRRQKGIARIELQFVLLASALGCFTAIMITTVLPIMLKNSQIVSLAPVAVLLFVGVIAYGIATRRIMEVGSVLRLLAAYGLLLVYLSCLYALTLYGARLVCGTVGIASVSIPYFLAALVMAFSLAPAHGRMHHVANKLFVNVTTTDVSRTVQRANAILQAIGTLDTLLGRFSSVVLESVGAADVIILLEEKGRFCQAYPRGPQEQRLPGGYMREDSPTIRTLAISQQPLIVDVLHRRQPSPLMVSAGEELSAMGVAGAVGIRSKSGLQGVMLLGPRLSGRVYGLLEQRALQIVGDQLAVAIENARLYTQLQDGKIYNDILLDSLVSGVVAVDSERRITVFNHEAERITGTQSDELIGKDMACLPDALERVLATTFSTGEGVRNRDVRIRLSESETVPIQMGSSVFHGHEGAVSGALLVFSDLSLVKKLETQVRRTAHLASVGTLSAGMAHEIKNPLVTLKTFSQLLGEQYDDPEFRETFSDLVGKEVNRIDRIVNQLLKFGRPAKAQLVEIVLRDVVEQSLQLVEVPMRKKGVSLRVDWHVRSSTTAGDPRLLEQAFVNFFLNAIDAMEGGGGLLVTLRQVRQPLPGTDDREDILPDRHLSVSIRDSGVGIKEEDLPHVFDPFFTTKSTGTGLGLSVVHSIIQEHGGMIDVESEFGVGTTFHVLLPIRRRGSYVENPDQSAATSGGNEQVLEAVSHGNAG
ncbi:MAG: PAS domain-containing protein [Verrucomicrobia bacterium]|jgi:PAS domain S-box-containing protein|nr:PAS domain-containing protein [Verrucomicrobiota bacterium]